MRRVVIVVLAAALVVVPPAGAWTWPAKGPVLQKFVLGDDPYAAGQHRGIDIGAPAGAAVAAPASGTVTFAGTVPISGRTVTIQTADGYSVTLTHLGSTSARHGLTIGEGPAGAACGARRPESGGYCGRGAGSASAPGGACSFGSACSGSFSPGWSCNGGFLACARGGGRPRVVDRDE